MFVEAQGDWVKAAHDDLHGYMIDDLWMMDHEVPQWSAERSSQSGACMLTL